MFTRFIQSLVRSINSTSVDAAIGTKLVYKVFLLSGHDVVGKMGMLGHFMAARHGNILSMKYHVTGAYYCASLEVAALAKDMHEIIRDASTSELFRHGDEPVLRTLPSVLSGANDRQYRLEISAMDHLGLVREVGELCARFNFNISFAHGVTYPEVAADQPYFALKMLLDVPADNKEMVQIFTDSLAELESRHGFKVYGPVPDHELTVFTPIVWSEHRNRQSR